MRTTRRLLALTILATSMGFVAGCSGGSSEGSAASQEVAANEGAPSGGEGTAPVLDGRTLYQTHCIGCHGEQGHGDGPLAASLPVQPANFLDHLGAHGDEDMILRITEGIPPAMPPAAIDREEVALVLDYIWSMVPDTLRPRLRAAQFLMMEEAH